MGLRRLVGRTAIGLAAAALAACVAFLLLRPAVETAARARIERLARGLGLSSTIGPVRVTPWLSLEVGALLVEDGRLRVEAHGVVVRPRLSWRGLLGRAARLELASAAADGPGGLRLELTRSAWAVESLPAGLRVRRLARGERLEVELTRGPDALAVRAHAEQASLSELLHLLVHGCTVARLGTADGDLGAVRDGAGTLRLSVDALTRGAAFASRAAEGGPTVACAALGAPTDAAIEAEVLLDPAAGSLRADRVRVTAGGAQAVLRLSAEGGLAAPRVDLALDVPRVDFARLLATAGLDLPADDLGSASLDLHISGPLLEPRALAVEQHIDFRPPARPLPSIERLKGPFVHEAGTPDGRTVAIRVSPDSPDFVPLSEVPPLFVRALLLGEDAGFFGHRGIDLAELTVALATDLARGSFARGGSTLSQQLAKNLFLSREKAIGRKLQEVSLALLLDWALGKERVLEIYLNVIEWGPGVFGLRPAARHYFGKEPAGLTPKEMAFLVSIVPGPIKYQRSIEGGVPSPFLEGVMATLLTKLQAVGALSETEYRAALAERLDLASPPAARRTGDRRRRLPGAGGTRSLTASGGPA